MSAAKRVAKELEQLQEQFPSYLRNLTYNDANILEWRVLLLPERPPYNLKAFKLCINFPWEYPLMPPKVTFMTQIYHPDVDDNGQICLPIISKENWKPYVHMDRVLDALNMLVNNPESGQSLHLAMAEELAQNPELFNRKAEEHTLRCGMERPP